LELRHKRIKRRGSQLKLAAARRPSDLAALLDELARCGESYARIGAELWRRLLQWTLIEWTLIEWALIEWTPIE
jgi:hypothetical protein